MKIKKQTLDQIYWYLSVRHIFNFDGKSYDDIEFDIDGIDGIECFWRVDTFGKKSKIPTRHPNIYKSLMKIKGSVNLHIKMYSEDRSNGILPKIIFDEMCIEMNLPKWFIDAVENQKYKYYKLNSF